MLGVIILTKLDLSNNQQLEYLKLGDNIYGGNRFTSDLSFLSPLVNLKRLDLGWNYFTDSLEPLQKLEKLEHLDVSKTEVVVF